MLKALKFTAMLALVVGVIANLPDITRYIRIRNM
jgi:hypothetical protein